jgi:hypothetical protein
MTGHPRQTKAPICREQLISLLYPVAAFFHSGGMTREQALLAFDAALDHVRESARRRPLEHIGASSCFLDVIATWTRDSRFLDSEGRPRVLSLSGKNGFSTLVKSTDAGLDPKEILIILMRYRNVRRLPGSKLRLVSPLFRASIGSRIAFEPMAHFLSDATSTLTHILRRTKATKPDQFWRSVESAHISAANAQKFIEFAKDRSLLFLEELDDWIQANERLSRRHGKRRLRVGLGLFSIYSNI